MTAGKNLLPNEWYAGSIDNNSGDEIDSAPEIRSAFVPVIGNTSYILTSTKLSKLQKGRMYDSEKHYIGFFNTGLALKYGTTFKTPTGCRFIRVVLTDTNEFQFTSNLAGTTLNGCDVQLELGSTATAYEPPNITTTPIDLDGHTLNSLPDGTCDELTIDATGAVTLTKRVGDVSVASGTALTYVNADNHRFNATITSGAGTTDYENGYSDKLPVRMNLGASPMGVIHSTAANMVSFYANKTIYSGSDAAKTAVQSVLPARLLYPLATPETIPLTPVTLPTLPSDKSNIYAASNVPTAGLTVRYWKKGGELVANLYKLLQNHEA